MKKLAAIITAILLSVSLLPAAAFAADTQVDLENSGGKLEITEAGTYVLTGSMQGSVYVDPGYGAVTLILDGADIVSPDSASIIAVSGESLTISVPEGSINRVSAEGTDSQHAAAIWSTVDTALEGNGELYVRNNSQTGIQTQNADLTVNSGNYSITAKTYGLSAAGGTLTINDGYLQLRCGIDIIDPDSDTVINGGTIIDLNAAAQNTGTTSAAETVSGNTASGTTSVEETASAAANGENTGAQSTETTSAAQDVTGNTASETTSVEATESADVTEETESEQASAIQQEPQQNPDQPPQMPNGEQPPQMPDGEQPPQMPDGTQLPQMPDGGQMNPFQNLESAEEASEIVYGISENSAMDLTEDLASATYITMTDDDSQVKITSSGTYVVSGTCSDGNITVKKGTTGVVLILEDLDLTSTTGATVSINKEAEVKIVISGEVVLTDAENPDDEYSEDADVADAYDGAALKAKANSQVYVTGDGTLTINGTAKNGIKAGDDSSLIFDEVTVNINAVNDGINANYDLTLLGGNFTITAGDDAIHADHILTVGDTDGSGPVIRVTDSVEGLEGTVVNVLGGDISIVSSDDAINAANGDALYEGELDYSFNMLGGKVSINSQGDGVDSNGNVNLIDGSMKIQSSAAAGEAGVDYGGQLYISDDFDLNNSSGVAGPDGMPGGMEGGQPGNMSGGQFGGQPGNMSGSQFGGQPGNMNGGQFGPQQ